MSTLLDMHRQHGVVLLIVLWMLTLITIIATNYTTATRTEMAIFTATRSTAVARAAAQAGIWMGVAKLSTRDIKSRWSTAGEIYSQEFGDAELRISIQDQAGLIDLNGASAELLATLFRNALPQLDAPMELVAQIMDWRDSDSTPEKLGAEDRDYHTGGFDYGAKDGPFNSVAELQQLLAFNSNIYAAVAPLLTVYSGLSEVNIKTAPPAVLELMPGLSEPEITQILKARISGDFRAVTNALSATQRRFLTNVQSKFYEVRAEATVDNSRVTIGALILIAPSSQRPYTILSWAEPARPLGEQELIMSRDEVGKS